MPMISSLSQDHLLGLSWFERYKGDEISWPSKLDSGLFLVNKAKGIHKPQGWKYALSIRLTMDSPYDNGTLEFNDRRLWSLKCAQEGENSEYFTNQSLQACIRDSVPIGFIQQISYEPSRYRVLGLARVIKFENGFFYLEEFIPTDLEFPTLSQPIPEDRDDTRKRNLVLLVQREGQQSFRSNVLNAYGNRCAISGCDLPSALEAAHIYPYRGASTNHVSNGILLRADLHKLFDLGLIGISPLTMKVIPHPSLKGTTYAHLSNISIYLPKIDSYNNFKSALNDHLLINRLA